MKINRAELVERIKALIAEREAEAIRNYEEALAKIQNEQLVHVVRTSDAWIVLANTVRRRVRQGKPVTLADVPEELLDRSRYGDSNRILLFKTPEIRRSEYQPRTFHLTRVLAVLESSPDEFVTDAALSRMGAPLKDLMRP